MPGVETFNQPEQIADWPAWVTAGASVTRRTVARAVALPLAPHGGPWIMQRCLANGRFGQLRRRRVGQPSGSRADSVLERT